MDEELSWFETDDFVGRDSTVSTAYPKVFWFLNIDEFLEVVGLLENHLLSPVLVVLEYRTKSLFHCYKF